MNNYSVFLLQSSYESNHVFFKFKSSLSTKFKWLKLKLGGRVFLYGLRNLFKRFIDDCLMVVYSKNTKFVPILKLVIFGYKVYDKNLYAVHTKAIK